MGLGDSSALPAQIRYSPTVLWHRGLHSTSVCLERYRNLEFLCFTCYIAACSDGDERVGFTVRVLNVESVEDDGCRENALFEARLFPEFGDGCERDDV